MDNKKKVGVWNNCLADSLVDAADKVVFSHSRAYCLCVSALTLLGGLAIMNIPYILVRELFGGLGLTGPLHLIIVNIGAVLVATRVYHRESAFRLYLGGTSLHTSTAGQQVDIKLAEIEQISLGSRFWGANVMRLVTRQKKSLWIGHLDSMDTYFQLFDSNLRQCNPSVTPVRCSGILPRQILLLLSAGFAIALAVAGDLFVRLYSIQPIPIRYATVLLYISFGVLLAAIPTLLFIDRKYVIAANRSAAIVLFFMFLFLVSFVCVLMRMGILVFG
jgi:hypothetical protein